MSSTTMTPARSNAMEGNLSGVIPHLFPAVRSINAEILLCLGGILFMAAAAQVRFMIPPIPVPFTLQTLGVLGIGILYGRRLAPITLGAYVALGAIGLPIFSGTNGGWEVVSGATFGFLLTYPVVGWLIGQFAQPEIYRSPLKLAAIVALGEAVIFTCGDAWLIIVSGLSVEQALVDGFLIFVPWEILKITILALSLPACDRFVRAVREESPKK